MAKHSRSNAAYKMGSARIKRIPARSAIALAISFSIQVSQAATLTVTTGVDEIVANSVNSTCNLREAILSINEQTTSLSGSGNQPSGCINSGSGFGTNDTILFDLSVTSNTTGLPSTGLFVGRSVSINPNGQKVAWNANGLSRHLTILTPAVVNIDNMTLSNGDFLEFSPGGVAGAGSSLLLYGGELTLKNTTVSGNTAGGAGAILATHPSVLSSITLNNSHIINNTGRDNGVNRNFGGGILLSTNAQATINNSTISGNSGDAGGAIAIIGGGALGGSLTINDSTISGNNAFDYGGGITTLGTSNNEVVLNIHNTTISGNTATQQAGIRLTNTAGGMLTTATLSNSTVADNIDGDAQNGNFGVGGIILNPARLVLQNTIIADSKFGGQDCFISGAAGTTIVSDQFSILETSTTCVSDARAIDPGLLALADNGGPTKTHALALNSTAVNSGNNATCLANDQRGVVRAQTAQDSCDVGAFEQTASDVAKLGGGFIVIPIDGGKTVVIPN